MKLTVTFKTPDAVLDAAMDATRFIKDDGAASEVRSAIHDALEKWVDYGEYVTIAFDTEAGTATVLPAR